MNLEIISDKPKKVSHKYPILFIHGAWHGAWCWKKYFMPYFAENGYESYALSFRGHGQSEKPSHFKWMRINDYVEDVDQIVRTLPEKPVLIGHSMGGLVVQKYLEEHSATAAILLAPVPVKGVLRTTLRILCRHPLAFLKTNLTWSLYPIIGNPKLAREAFFSLDIPIEIMKEYFDLMQDESYLAFLDMMIFKLPKPKNVSTDLLILGAEEDTIFYPDEINETAEAYDTKAEFFENMAHDMMLEDNWQTVADRIFVWLGKKGI